MFIRCAIESCINVASYLPFPTNDACKVIEAIGGFVKWNMQDVRIITEMNPCDKVDEKVFEEYSNMRNSMDSISHVATIDCCQDKCCQIVDREAIHQLRKYLWGLDLEDRTNYVYDMLESSCRYNNQ